MPGGATRTLGLGPSELAEGSSEVRGLTAYFKAIYFYSE